MPVPTVAPDPFLTAFRGSFTAALRWPQLDALWARVRADAGGGWYLYAIGEPPPARPASAAEVEHFVAELDRLLRAEHTADYCGIVYADDPAAPTLIKVYDPNNLGMVCGSSTQPPLPGWVLSKLPPVDLPATRLLAANRRRWWQRLFARGPTT
ncbi:MAG: hypothetical protein EA400_16395 [Chromatiaceae bacterium]|nr:MAG: hypothetical protein EA400_16395 [Chromatiaceae bacterium]